MFSNLIHYIVSIPLIFAALIVSFINPSISPSPMPTPQPIAVYWANGEYKYQGYSANVVIEIPQSGGQINGTIDGDCKGNIQGNFDGQDGGILKGDADASCYLISFINIHGTATFDGKLFIKNKSGYINFKAKADGQEQDGSIDLIIKP